MAKKKADKAKRRAEKAAKIEEKMTLAMLADRATKIKSRPKSGRKTQGPPPNKMFSTKHSALKKEDYDIIPEEDLDESFTDPEPLQ